MPLSDITDSLKHRQQAKFWSIPHRTIDKYTEKENVYITEKVEGITEFGEKYNRVYYEGLACWYPEDVEHNEYPNKFDLRISIDGIRYYDNASKDVLLYILKNLSHADEIHLDREPTIRLWWD